MEYVNLLLAILAVLVAIAALVLSTPKDCKVCEAHKDHIRSLNYQISSLQTSLAEYMMKKSVADEGHPGPLGPLGIRENIEPVPNRGQSWRDLQVKLEEKYRAKKSTPEDVKEHYWREKNKQTEKELGIIAEDVKILES